MSQHKRKKVWIGLKQHKKKKKKNLFGISYLSRLDATINVTIKKFFLTKFNLFITQLV